MKSKAILSLMLLFCVFHTTIAQTKTAAPPPAAQKPSDDKDDDVVRITTNLVQVDAVVTKDGKIVPDLTADDFEIYEDGKKQTISSFAFISNVTNPTAVVPKKEKEKPTEIVPTPRLNPDDPRRTVALVVDDLGLSAESMFHVRKQLRKFIAEELQPNDLVALIRTSGELGALQQFTNDKRLLDRAVDRLRWNICSRVGVSVIPRYNPDTSSLESASPCGGNTFFKTLKALRFVIDAMGQIPGRKSMVILSDSMPMEDQEMRFANEALNTFPDTRDFQFLLQTVAERAIRASVVIYAVDTQGLQVTSVTAADDVRFTRENMNTLTGQILTSRSNLLWDRRRGGDLIARQTGGFQVRNKNNFDLPRILQEQNGYYLLGYKPTTETFNRRFHHIKAKVKRSGMTLRTRYGFYGVSEEEARPMQLLKASSTNLALASPFGAQDIEVDLVSFFTNDKTGAPIVRSFVYIDPKDLTFEYVHGMRRASFELHGVIFGDNGIVVEHQAGGATLTLTEQDYEQAMRNRMATTIDMPVKKPGSYQIRVATRDRTSTKLGSAG